ncbi:MAG: 30S ribosomal protein S6 [Chloroflexi bacterium]|nr:30S ribosomal protein S6 [Chloroflexota bacterium]
MNPYEITFIVRPDLEDDQTRGVAEQVTRRLEAMGGEIIAVYPWSPPRRRMAYPIRDFGDGYYVTATFRFNPQSLRELENGLKLNENILRFLVVQATDLQIRQSQVRAQQLAAAAAPPPPQGVAPQPGAPAGGPPPPSGITPPASGPAPMRPDAPPPGAPPVSPASQQLDEVAPQPAGTGFSPAAPRREE